MTGDSFAKAIIIYVVVGVFVLGSFFGWGLRSLKDILQRDKKTPDSTPGEPPTPTLDDVMGGRHSRTVDLTHHLNRRRETLADGEAA